MLVERKTKLKDTKCTHLTVEMYIAQELRKLLAQAETKHDLWTLLRTYASRFGKFGARVPRIQEMARVSAQEGERGMNNKPTRTPPPPLLVISCREDISNPIGLPTSRTCLTFNKEVGDNG